jgi:hypothetical protein
MPGENVECSFCGRDIYNTLHMIKSNGTHICRECVIKGVDLLTSTKPKPLGGSSVKKTYRASDIGHECTFCSRKVIDVRAATTITDGKHRICDECLMVCFDVMLRTLFGERKPSSDSLRFFFN